MVKRGWIPYNSNANISTSRNFKNSLLYLKRKVVEWVEKMFNNRDKNLKVVDESIYPPVNNLEGVFSMENLDTPACLKFRKANVLEDREAYQRMKSRATWMELGDETI